jgi:hypothetical protein
VSEGVVQRRRARRRRRETDNIGSPPLTEFAQFVEPSGARTVDRRHLEESARRQYRRVERVDFLESAGLFHLRERVERVVRRRAVVAKGNVDATVEVVDDRRDAACEFHVRRGTVHDVRAGFGEQFALALVGPDAVGEHDILAGETHFVEPVDVPAAGVGLNSLDFPPVLAGVGVDADAVVGVCEVARAAQARLRAGDREPWRDGVPDSVAETPVVALDEALALREGGVGLFEQSLGRAPVHQHFAEHAPDAEFAGGLERPVGVRDRQVVDSCRCPALDEFQIPQFRRRLHLVGRQCRLQREHVVEQPVEQLTVLCTPPAEALDRVDVAPDQSRNHEVTAHLAVVGILRSQFCALADGPDVRATHDDASLIDNSRRIRENRTRDEHRSGLGARAAYMSAVGFPVVFK